MTKNWTFFKRTKGNKHTARAELSARFGAGSADGGGMLESLESRVLLSTTYYVATTGSDSAGGTQSAPFRTLAKALNTVGGGDTVVLRGGSYAGGVAIEDPNVTVKSYTGEKAVITAPTSNSTYATQQAILFDVTSSGSKLQGLDVSGGYYYAIKLESDGNAHATNITIEDCKLHDSGRDVIKVTPGCDDSVIRRNEIFNSGRRDASNAEGIDNVNADRALIQDNYIHDIATNGLYVKGGAIGAVIERNRIERTGGAGLTLGYLDTDAPFFDAANTQYYENIDGTVRNNIIVDAKSAGIALYGSLRPRVYNNTIVNGATSNQAGILIAAGQVTTDSGTMTPATTDAQIINNIVTTPSRPSVQIWGGAVAGSLTMSNNRYFKSSGGSASFVDERKGFTGNLSQWKSSSGTDGNSTEGDPKLDANEHLTSTSPSIDAGKDLSGTGFANDFDSQARPGGAAWDVGADEVAGSTPPADTTAPTISGVSSSGVGQTGASVGWQTNESSDTQVEYGTSTAYGNATALNSGMVTSHSAALAGLAAGTTYHYRVKSRDAAGNLAVSGDFTFTTTATPPADTTAPTIAGVSSSNVSASGASVAWTTNEASDTQVEYGTSTAYGASTVLNTADVTSHSAALSGLSANTTYHYRVRSRDAAGNLAVSGDFTFTTTAASTSPTVFSTTDAGDFATYSPLTSSRWSVTTDSTGNKRLFLNTSAYNPAVEDTLGEYALVNGTSYGDFDLTVSAKTNESLSANPSADYVLVFGYVDANNYSYLMLSARANNTRFFKVTNGVPTAYASTSSVGIPDTNWHSVQLSRRGSTLTVLLDGRQILSTTNSALATAGRVGVGSYNDSAYFDDVNVA